MPELTTEDRGQIDAFLDFVADACDADDRYGDCSQHEFSDGRIAACFTLSDVSWLEVSVDVSQKVLRVGFLCEDAETMTFIEEELADSAGVESLMASAAAAAGLDAQVATAERCELGGAGCYCTTLELESLDDLNLDFLGLRDKAVRLLETYFIGFGSFIGPEELGDDDEEDELAEEL